MSIATLVEQNLCVADMEDFEQAVGVPLLDTLEKLKADEMPSNQILTGLIWIAKRHEDSDFTMEDARHVPLSELIIDARTNPTRAERRAKTGVKKTAAKKTTAKRKSGIKR